MTAVDYWLAWAGITAANGALFYASCRQLGHARELLKRAQREVKQR